MKTLPDEIVAEAFALSNARGADLLARLGRFNVWRGDLATMRGDNPRAARRSEEPDATQETVSNFRDTLLLAKAIELLSPVCRATLSAIYAEKKDAASLAAELDTVPEDAERIARNCEKRLMEAYDSLTTLATGESSVPRWVSEREHAAADAGRRR